MNEEKIVESVLVNSDLLKVIVPACITAAISILSLALNSIFSWRTLVNTRKKEKYDKLSDFYPHFRTKLISISITYQRIIACNTYIDMDKKIVFNLNEFIKLDVDDLDKKYKIHDYKEGKKFIQLINDLVKLLIDLCDFFEGQIVPIEKKELQIKILKLHEYCIFVKKLKDDQVIDYRYINACNFDFEYIDALIQKLDEDYHKL